MSLAVIPGNLLFIHGNKLVGIILNGFVGRDLCALSIVQGDLGNLYVCLQVAPAVFKGAEGNYFGNGADEWNLFHCIGGCGV